MKAFISLMAFLLFVLPLGVNAEEVIKKGESLDLARCLDIALKMQPSRIAAESSVNASASRVGQAKANYYPQVDWTSSANRTSVGPKTSLGFRTGSVLYNSYLTGVTLNQNLFDFGKTSTQVRIQKLNLESSRSELVNVTDEIIFNVKQAYYGAVQAKYNRLVAEDTVKQTQQHLEQAKGFFKAGTKPRFDVTQAEVNLSTAKLNLIKADNALKLAIANLNNAMGTPDAPEYSLEENISFLKYEIDFEEALDRAYGNRPDLQSLVAQRQAAENSVDLAKKGYYPMLTGNAGYNYAGNTFPLERGWNIGATLSFPVFSGFLTKYQVEEAKANLNVLKANEESLKQTIFLEVQDSYLTLRAAEDAIPTAKLGVEQAQENLDIANGRYAAGVGSPVEVTDAEVGVTNARTSYIQALYADKVAKASLEKAMGVR